MSNYWSTPNMDEVHEDRRREVRCSTCKGFGFVEVQGQETDCIDCEGFGSVLV